jgi:hypothetical protein
LVRFDEETSLGEADPVTGARTEDDLHPDQAIDSRSGVDPDTNSPVATKIVLQSNVINPGADSSTVDRVAPRCTIINSEADTAPGLSPLPMRSRGPLHGCVSNSGVVESSITSTNSEATDADSVPGSSSLPRPGKRLQHGIRKPKIIEIWSSCI